MKRNQFRRDKKLTKKARSEGRKEVASHQNSFTAAVIIRLVSNSDASAYNNKPNCFLEGKKKSWEGIGAVIQALLNRASIEIKLASFIEGRSTNTMWASNSLKKKASGCRMHENLIRLRRPRHGEHPIFFSRSKSSRRRKKMTENMRWDIFPRWRRKEPLCRSLSRPTSLLDGPTCETSS